MPDSSAFPQIPTTVWWGVRALLNKSPRAVIGEDVLGAELGVQPAAARQYVSELKRVGLLGDESRATELANKWRLDDTYSEAVSEILDRCYGEGLRTVAPTPAERSKAVDWFKRQGLGEGSAGNKAATYFLIASPVPGESPSKSGTAGAGKQRPPKPKAAPVEKPQHQSAAASRPSAQEGSAGIFPVNLNLQIHISADATSDQIDAIFSSMRKHLGNARLS